MFRSGFERAGTRAIVAAGQELLLQERQERILERSGRRRDDMEPIGTGQATSAMETEDGFPTGESALARLIRSHDWAATSLGPISGWSGTLRSTLGFVLEAPLPLALLWGPEGVLLYNEPYAALSGDRHPSILGMPIRQAWPEAEAFNAHVLEETWQGRTLSYKDLPFLLRRHDEPASVWLSLHYSVVRDRQGEPAGVLAVVMETTERILLERQQLAASQALRSSEAQLRALTAALPQIIWTADAQGRYDFFNERWRELTGLDPAATGQEEWLSVVHPEDRAAAARDWQAAIATGSLYQTEYRLQRADGSWRWFLRRAIPVKDEESQAVIRWLGTCTDIHETVQARMLLRQNARDLEARVQERTRELEAEQQERLRAEEQLRQAQKMEAIGNLTGGISHDFNNLLQIIHGSLELLTREVSHLPQARMRIDHALQAVRRGSRLAQQLLAFGRRQPLQPKVINIGRLLAELEELLRRTLGEGIEIRLLVEDGLGNALLDPSQVENALLNLAINARDAMEGEGCLTIEARNTSLPDGDSRLQDGMVASDYVCLSVHDTGGGIPPEILEKVFEPFFTTKPEGKGSGLGLSMVYGFVRQSGGSVRIDSELGRGTVVQIHLPRVAAPEQRAAPAEEEESRGGTETILVVEDDDSVREVVFETLSGLGYRVVRARDATSALTILESGLPIDLLFTDVVMPGPVRSTEMVARARQLYPGIAVLYTSGYAESAIVHEGRLDAGIELLGKPYTRDALARRIRTLLRARSVGNPTEP
jgi:PAS domain S-box-containing protein